MKQEDKADFPRDAKPWHALLREAERRDDPYHQRCDRVDEAYASLKDRAVGDRELQVFWANLEVLKPTIYSRPPVPVVSPRFRDRKPLPRRASELVERALITDIELDKVHDKLVLARDDLARNARGVMWVVADRNPVRARAKWIPRKDFRHGWGRCWDEVPWVAKAAFLTEDEFRRRFKEVPKGTEFKVREHVVDDEKEGFDAKARVWEIWHKGKGKVVWVADGAEAISDAQDPWVDLEEFWPVPRPAYGTLVPETLTPVPDVAMYQDQLEEINELTDRIAKLTDTLRLKGFYAAGSGDIGGAIEIAMSDLDNRTLLVPVSSLAALGGAGLKDAIIWMPINEVAQTLQVCIEVRKQLMQDVYEVTGLSDIMRGATEAQETLGAQQLKAQFGSVRVKERQGEMQRLARDVFRIKAEIMAEQYPPEELLSMSQIDDLPSAQDLQMQAQQIQQQAFAQGQKIMAQMEQMPPEQQQQAQQQIEQGAQQVQQQLGELQQTVTIDAVMQLLRDNRIRPFAIEVETDSTIEPDQMAEKQTRTEFMQALGPMLQQGVAAMQTAPQLGAFVAESIRFVASGFKVPRSMDDAVDELAEGFADYQPQPQGGEDPEAAKMTAQAEMAKAQAAGTMAQAKAEEAQAKTAMLQADMQIKAQEAQTEGQKTGVEIEKLHAEIAKIQAEIGLKQQQAAVAEQSAQVDMALKVQGEQRTEAQSEQDAQFREREFQRSAETQGAAEKRADAESKAKVQSMRSKPNGNG